LQGILNKRIPPKKTTRDKISSYETNVSNIPETCLPSDLMQQSPMSSKNNSLSTSMEPENPYGGGSQQNTMFVDPLDRIYEPSEDSDWEAAFIESIRPTSTNSTQASSTPAPSISWKDEDKSDNMDITESPTLESINSKEKKPNNHLDENSQLIELQVPVVTVPPESLVSGLWSQEFISSSPPRYNSIPLYLAEGREDPEKDEGIEIPSSPLSSSQGSTIPPMLSGQTRDHVSQEIITTTHSHDPQTIIQDPLTIPQDPQTRPLPLQQEPEAFIDRCGILQWVIDDSDISMTPNAFATDFIASATITSGAFNRLQATTTNFITPVKSDVEPVSPVAGPSSYIAPSSSLVKSESHAQDPDWPLDLPYTTGARKRGRPAKPLGSHTITPLPSRPSADHDLSDSSVTMTDDEVSAAKWRRMRDLNNEASRRCRAKRNEKQEAAKRELHALQERNFRLKRIVAKMEAEMKKLKRRILTDVRSSSRAAQSGTVNRGASDSSLIQMLLSGTTDDLPDSDTMWSERE